MVAIYGRDGIAPGRVVYAGGLDDGRDLSWLYVVAVTGDLVSGVRFDNTGRNGEHRTGFFGVSVDALLNQSAGLPTHPLSVVDWWPETVATFLAAPSSFPDVTLPQVAPAPAPDLSGDMIDRAEIVRKLTRASEVASQYADDNSLCGEFERCMEAIGLQDLGLTSLRERERLYDVTYDHETECDTCGHETTESTTVQVWITARNDDHAWDVLTEGGTDYMPGWDGDSDAVDLQRA